MQRLRSSLKKSISIHGLPLKILIFPPRILLRDIAWFSPLELPLLPLPLLGYSLRHLHDIKVDQRLQSIENSMKNNSNLQHSQIKDIVAGSASGAFSIPACVATAGTSLIIGYALGWRGGIWYATKKFRKEQMKMLGQITPKRWQLLGKIKPRGFQFQFLRRKLTRFKVSDTATKNLKRV
ncbi:hypothetical protein GLYMA_14G050300v4 [Glycine max]|nr:hypothetical protein GLYMA_14G050300v4 [Glycine max]